MFPALVFLEPDYLECALRKLTEDSPVSDIGKDLDYELEHE